MNTQIQTATLGGTTDYSYLAPLALAALGDTLWHGRNEQRNASPVGGSSLRSALACGERNPHQLMLACRDDTELAFGITIRNEFGILGYTGRIVIIGFAGHLARGYTASVSASAAANDPIWALWPWGYLTDSDIGRCMHAWAQGVTDMLNGNWTTAVDRIKSAAIWTTNIANREQLLLRRALRTNLALAVRYSHEGALP